jgi:hypothetical protein
MRRPIARPDAQRELAVSVDYVGFRRVDVDAVDLITDRTWRQAVDMPAPSAARVIVEEWAPSPLDGAPPSSISSGLGMEM